MTDKPEISEAGKRMLEKHHRESVIIIIARRDDEGTIKAEGNPDIEITSDEAAEIMATTMELLAAQPAVEENPMGFYTALMQTISRVQAD